MYTKFQRAAVASLVGSVLALSSFAAQADVDACRALTGFDTANGGIITGDGAWAAVAANRDSFLGKRNVADCEVPVVTSSGKGKPAKSVFLAGPMTSDECSMYKYLSSIDSKLATDKVDTALTTVTSMIAKVDDIAAQGKLVDPGYTEIRDAASAIEECIALLP